MKYTLEQRLDIGLRIYEGELTRFQAAEEYGINDNTARNYMRLYRDTSNLPPKNAGRKSSAAKSESSNPIEVQQPDLEFYESTTKEELIQALVQARITEAWLKRLRSEGGWFNHSVQQQEYQMILHSDQGSVYASKAFNDLLPMYVTRSMSRAGTPTDNSAMESINDWIKAELFIDMYVTGERPVKEEIDDYIKFFNEERPAYALSYLTPKQYREKYAA